MTKNPPYKSLAYEFETTPEVGQSIEILPGVRWLRMPLPFMLGHINLWLLEDGDGWVIVDTGLNTHKTKELWQQVLGRDLGAAPVNRVLVTHLHPDHSGCAGWLAEHCHAPLWMSREEYLLCRVLAADTGKTAPAEAIAFYAASGFTGDALKHYQNSFGSFGKYVSELPQSYHRLTQGMQIEIGRHRWTVLIGRGHSVEHACLYCEELNTLISGDQILPTISSNVSVWPTEPAANPLQDWLDSLASLRETLPEDVLVLPAHGKPFRGAHLRLTQLIDEHLEGLEKLRVACVDPLRAVDVFPLLFNSEINQGNLIMATGEAIGHLHYLEQKGELKTWLDDEHIRWYQLK